ncbi:uncharacterized protein VICG_01880 [Vittaforma corneae ATCC 50505]|uniref:RRM domain-containing protein n=1 Tax=Vittaforma corneae (strain ATCC 50505) TaxID=993615 RepID=L2GLD1_VITCO|nr:uncharacterized protein VICG_01880 [Vittaforma corneae ATCC 50505]ELA41087.1 hypothetical protein VICG_01880 [Vittaforma corneae ATCC 50505]
MQNQILDYFNIRVVQRNLVYVIGIPQKYAEEEALKRHEFFGQFGSIKKIIINKRTHFCDPFRCTAEPTAIGIKGQVLQGDLIKNAESTASAYITFNSDNEAKWCIQEVDESMLDGKILRCTYGTTKYCSFYLKNIPCQNNECMYLHENRPPNDILTKDELLSTKHKLHDFEPNNRGVERIGKRKRFDFLDDIIHLKTHITFKPPRRILFEPKDFNQM